MKKCPSYRSVRLTVVRLIKVFLHGRQLRSAGTFESVRLREVSVLWNVRLKKFLLHACKTNFAVNVLKNVFQMNSMLLIFSIQHSIIAICIFTNQIFTLLYHLICKPCLKKFEWLWFEHFVQEWNSEIRVEHLVQEWAFYIMLKSQDR